MAAPVLALAAPRASRSICLMTSYRTFRHASSTASSSKTLPAPRSIPGSSQPVSRPAPRAGSSGSSSTEARPSAGHNTSRPPLRSAWPWRRVAHPAASADGTGASTRPEFIEEERVIYARPYEGPFGTRVRMLWFLFPFGGLIVGAYLSKPNLRRRGEVVEAGSEEPQAAGAAGDVVGGADGQVPAGNSPDEWVIDDSRPWYWSPDKLAVILGASIMCGVWTFLPTRFITRLVLVRRTPTAAAGTPGASAPIKATEVLRLQHGGHHMSLGETLPYREVALGNVTVRAIGRPGASSYLNLNIKPGTGIRRFGLDRWSYRLDFRDTPVVKNSPDEVVLSLNRVEHVFGALR